MKKAQYQSFFPSSLILHPVRNEVSVVADVILHNARIATNRAPSLVEAVAIEGGKFLTGDPRHEIIRRRGRRLQSLTRAAGRSSPV